MLRILFFCCAFVFSAGAWAQTPSESSTESIVSGVNAKGEKVFLVRYLEDRLWVVDEIVQHRDGWQDLLSRHYAQDRSTAELTQLRIQKKYPQIQSVNPSLQIQSTAITLKGGSLWATTQTWSWEWEKKYAEWLSENMTSDFYSKYKIATDCADVAYAARWIFARIHGLPAANRLSGSGTLLTNQSLRAEWAQLPPAKNWFEDKRFRAALNYLLNQTYTHTLMRDSYPIAITAENFLPGAHYLDLRDSSGHTQLVHRVDLSEQGIMPYIIIQSTVPRKVRDLNESLFWGHDQAKKDQSGFLRILWPQVKNGTYSLEKSTKMPGYSLEQYSPDFIREKDRAYSIEIFLRLNPNLNFVKLAETGYQNLMQMLQTRVGIVEEGYRQCPNHSCLADGQRYDDWSTPSRDKHLLEVISQLEMLSSLPLPPQVRNDIQKVKDHALNSVALTLDGENFTLKALIFAWKNNIFSSDPNDEPGLRWGVAPESFALKIQRDFTKLITERKIKISKEADNLLKKNLIVSSNYCKYFTPDQCQRFTQNELPKQFQLLGKTKSLQEWLEYSLWLNSDPLQTPVNQWGGLREKSKFQPLADDVKIFTVTKDGVGYLETTSGEKRLGPMGPNGIEDQPLPADFRWVILAKDSSTAWALSDQQILRYDFQTQMQNIFALPAPGAASILNANSSALLLQTQDAVWSLEYENGALKTVWNAAVSSPKFFESRVLLGKLADHWAVFDFSSSTPQVIPLNEDLSSAVVFKNTNRYVGLTIDTKNIFVDKTNGTIIDVSPLGFVAKWSDGLSKALVFSPNPMSWNLISLDSNFNIVTREKIADFGVSREDYFISMTEGRIIFSHLKGEDFVQLPLVSDEESATLDFSLPWVLMKLKTPEGSYRLRNLDGSKVLYEGGPIKVIAEQATQNFAFSFKPEEREMRLIFLKTPQTPALMTGEFLSHYRSIDFNDPQFQRKFLINRGLALSYQGYKFWVEFQ